MAPSFGDNDSFFYDEFMSNMRRGRNELELQVIDPVSPRLTLPDMQFAYRIMGINGNDRGNRNMDLTYKAK